MEGITDKPIIIVNDSDRCEKCSHKHFSDNEDTYSSSKAINNLNVASVALAGGSSIAAYKGVKGLASKAIVFINKELTEFMGGIGKTFKGLSPKSKTIATFGAALLGAVGAFALAIKDKDGDGKLDVLEGFVKMLHPDS